jgi:1,2-dihydroxy-3-keto-5-methylthiopentene dioxygenase
MRAYVYDIESAADQRAPHDTGIEKSVEDLEGVGVLYWKIEGSNVIEQIDKIAKERSYKNRDEVISVVLNSTVFI